MSRLFAALVALALIGGAVSGEYHRHHSPIDQPTPASEGR